jgi:[protein-PII] uridylyltransferase
MTGDPAGDLRRDLDALAAAYTLGQHGRWVAERRTDLVDAALVAFWKAATAPPAMTLVAIGGTGRRRQLPRSDIDVLLVHADAEPHEVQRVADAILYPLWDAGFTVGHAVRSPAECLEAAERLDALTAMLDARVLAGDDALAAEALDPVRALATAEPLGFAARLERDRVARRERRGSSAHLLEPDLKDGTGGLRDIDALRWLATAVGASLEEAGLLSRGEASAVDDAEEFLVRARSAVHLVTERRADRLVTELQEPIAAGFGFDDAPRLAAPDALMRTLFERARDVEHAVSMATARLASPPATSVDLAPGPGAALAALGDLAERGEPPPPALLDAIAAASPEVPEPWPSDVLDAFLRLLRAGEAGTAMLDVLDRMGLLVRYLPCWADVRCRPQRDPYHRFTVDAHLLAAAAWFAASLRDPDADPDDPIIGGAAGLLVEPDGALVGALLHDIGKVGEGNHVPAGAAIAERQFAAMGLPGPAAELARFMVAEHLLLPDTATRRDLTDENLILDVAAKVGTPERLAALSLLARADAAATGPAAWTTWRRTLVGELIAKVHRVLERGTMGEELAATLAERVGRVRDLLAGEADAEVDAFVLRMPRGYFLSVEPDRAAAHFHTIGPHVGSHDVRSAAAPGARAGTYELLVVAADRPGLLSSIAGALAVGGISILSAQVFTTDDGVAADLFEVEGAFEPDITEARWRSFRATLRRSIEGSISLDHRVEETRRHYPRSRVGTPVTVRVDNDASDFATVIEVGAPDRIGLLFDITRAFAALDLDVHLAKVATFDGRVVDAFYVRDRIGRKVLDDERLGSVDRAMRARLG